MPQSFYKTSDARKRVSDCARDDAGARGENSPRAQLESTTAGTGYAAVLSRVGSERAACSAGGIFPGAL